MYKQDYVLGCFECKQDTFNEQNLMILNKSFGHSAQSRHFIVRKNVNNIIIAS